MNHIDYAIKNNIHKTNRIMVDIGSRYTKIIGVTYSNKKISINSSFRFDSKLYYSGNDLTNISELVGDIDDLIGKGKLPKRADISVSLPSPLVYHKVIEAKNIKHNEIDKYIRGQNILSNKISSLTHSIDWAYLGEREKSGETIKYCLVAAVGKSTAMSLVKEFEAKKLRVVSIGAPVYNLICLSELYFNDYDNVNKVMMDFGSASTRVVIVHEGIAIYSRDIGIGYDNFEQNFEESAEFLHTEIMRIIEFCESNGIEITKIIYTGYLPEMVSQLLTAKTNVMMEFFDVESIQNIRGKNYVLSIEKTMLDTTFSSSIGLCLTPFM